MKTYTWFIQRHAAWDEPRILENATEAQMLEELNYFQSEMGDSGFNVFKFEGAPVRYLVRTRIEIVPG